MFGSRCRSESGSMVRTASRTVGFCGVAGTASAVAPSFSGGAALAMFSRVLDGVDVTVAARCSGAPAIGSRGARRTKAAKVTLTLLAGAGRDRPRKGEAQTVAYQSAGQTADATHAPLPHRPKANAKNFHHDDDNRELHSTRSSAECFRD